MLGLLGGPLGSQLLGGSRRSIARGARGAPDLRPGQLRALLASWTMLASSGLFLTEARAERARKADNDQLLFQLEPGHVFSTQNSGII